MLKNLFVASATVNAFLVVALYLFVSGHVILADQMHDIVAAAEMSSAGKH